MRAFAKVSKRYWSNKPINMKVLVQQKNPISGDSDWVVQDDNYDFHQEIARSAFADMLHDTERNKKYHRALQIAIEKMHSLGKKAHVLDIGTGTGLLSIMAAKCGADTITACEAFKPMADCCLKILERNGVADKITIIPKRSTEMTVGDGADMKQRANILVTEVFDTELIGEGALSTFTHAHKELLEKDCIVVPDSAVIYAQVVECPTLQKWNKLNDLVDEDANTILRTPLKMKNCAGSAAVHDVQLSQLSRHNFTELSDQIPVLYYDWSGQNELSFKKTIKQQFKVTNSGRAQAVFMWWELNMDTEGRITLSCAPWWYHPDANTSSERPQDSIPWRDHWMQAVYYLPQETQLEKGSEVDLLACQDEYSLWFYLETEKVEYKNYMRPICECGVHMALSRTHVSYLNDGRRSKKFLSQLRNDINKDSVVLDLNGSSFLGLASSKLGAKKVYILENMSLTLGFLYDYINENKLDNIEIIEKLNDDICGELTNVVCDPNFVSAILPWENLKMAHCLYQYKDKLKNNVKVMPGSCDFWVMPVEFKDLQKIRIPLGNCEGINMDAFDRLVESSRTISDDELEAQPLWEYPCLCRGEPTKLLTVDMNDLQKKMAVDQTHSFGLQPSQTASVNGFVVWSSWNLESKSISCGPTESPIPGEYVEWDMHTRQAIKILKETREVSSEDTWNYQLACDIETGEFSLNVDIVNSDKRKDDE